MSTVKVRSMEGKEVGTLALPESLVAEEKGSQAVRDAVVRYMANQRSGTASTKTKAEVSGAGSKPWRQKGTGRARAGYRSSPVWRGGGVAFGPRPRSFRKSINRKTARLALKRAIAERVAADQIIAVDALTVSEPKTKQVVAALSALGVSGPALIVTGSLDRNLVLAARNLKGVEVTTASDLNVYQVMRYPSVIIAKEAVEVLEKRLTAEENRV